MCIKRHSSRWKKKTRKSENNTFAFFFFSFSRVKKIHTKRRTTSYFVWLCFRLDINDCHVRVRTYMMDYASLYCIHFVRSEISVEFSFFSLCTLYKRTIQLRLHLRCSSQKISLFLFWILGLFVIKPYSIVMNPKKNSFGLRAAILRMENQLNLGFFGIFFWTSFSSFSNYFFEFTTFWGRKKFHP